jgi:drug/metabolite transporter (DMT)-like permease
MKERARANPTLGAALNLASAFLFSIASLFAKEVMMVGITEGTLIFARGILAWTLNGLIAKAQGDQFVPVMFFRTSSRLRLILVANGTLNFVCLLSFMVAMNSYVDFADTFGILTGVYALSTMAFSRMLDKSEHVSLAELVGAAITVGGVIIISQPSWLFAARKGARPIHPFGVFLCVLGGVFVGAYTVVCRYLAMNNVSGAMVNSAAMWVLSVLSPLTLAVCAVCLEQTPHWAQLHRPEGGSAWSLLLGYCAAITSAQLALITSVQHVRAAVAAILGIVILGQPTNALAILGNIVVFAGCAVVALGAARETEGTAAVAVQPVITAPRVAFCISGLARSFDVEPLDHSDQAEEEKGEACGLLAQAQARPRQCQPGGGAILSGHSR